MPSRWFGVSIQPPVPGVDASTNERGDTQRALPDVLITSSRVTSWARSRAGSTCTCSWRSCWPQTATFETPWTPTRRGAIVHFASTDMSSAETLSEETEIIINLLADASGCSIWGGFDTCGRACACVSRSATTWRARKRSVPGSKMRRMRDSPATDSERMSSRKATPFSRSCSSGTVISCSTSLADRPSASVWISTVAGVKSGRTSTGMSRSCETPTIITAAAAATTISRNRTDEPTIHRII